tara:strand:+ start:342 stop:707 length:366 start_codon:yes stop_codon:yes gene_type:complete
MDTNFIPNSYFDAAVRLFPTAHIKEGDGSYEALIINGHTKPTKATLDSELQKVIDAEPMYRLRCQRDIKLTKTDWWASSDLTMTAEQTKYRKDLRDFPSTASPELDSGGNLTNVTWPTKPE